MTGRRWWWWTWVVVVAVALVATSYADARAIGYLRTRPDSTSTSTWPATMTSPSSENPGVVTLVRGARNDPSDLSFRVTFPATPDRWSYVVVDCDTGRIFVDGEGLMEGPCSGHVNGLMGAGGQPHSVTYTVRVSEPQKRPWGVAYYS